MHHVLMWHFVIAPEHDGPCSDSWLRFLSYVTVDDLIQQLRLGVRLTWVRVRIGLLNPAWMTIWVHEDGTHLMLVQPQLRHRNRLLT